MRTGTVAIPVLVALLLAGCGDIGTLRASGAATTTSSTTAQAVTPDVGITPARSSGGFEPPRGSEVPASCSATPSLAPVAPTPAWPNEGPPGGYPPPVVDSALSAQYPTVYGGLIGAPTTPGEPPADARTHFIILETVRDPGLESEAKSPYPVMKVAFQLTPHSLACLKDVFASINKAGGMSNAVYGIGIVLLTTPSVQIQTTACAPAATRALTEWFAQRWGDAVSLQFCGSIPKTT